MSSRARIRLPVGIELSCPECPPNIMPKIFRTVERKAERNFDTSYLTLYGMLSGSAPLRMHRDGCVVLWRRFLHTRREGLDEGNSQLTSRRPNWSLVLNCALNMVKLLLNQAIFKNQLSCLTQPDPLTIRDRDVRIWVKSLFHFLWEGWGVGCSCNISKDRCLLKLSVVKKWRTRKKFRLIFCHKA